MTNTEILHQPESQEGFTQHEFGKMIETPTARALLVNEDYGRYGLTSKQQEKVKNMYELTKIELGKLPFNLELQQTLLNSLVSIQLETPEGNYWKSGSGVFIRPNVILTAAHVVRNPIIGEIDMMRAIEGNNKSFKVKSLYFTKIRGEDVAFIVTDIENTGYVDIYNRGLEGRSDIHTLGMSSFQPRFKSGDEGSTWYQKFLFLTGSLLSDGYDRDNDGVPDSQEYSFTDVNAFVGDSGGIAVSSTGELKGIVSHGAYTNDKGETTGGTFLEPQSKIVKQYGDFIQAMTKLGVEIK